MSVFRRREADCRAQASQTIGYIPQPNYLLAGPADACIEKLSADLMQSQIQVFAKLIHTIDAMSASQLRKT